MRTIYTQAAVVLVWLGDPSEDSDAAMEKLVEIRSRADHLLRSRGWSSILSALSPADPVFYGEQGTEQHKKCQEGWKAITSLLARPWFAQAWIVQEATAQSNVVYCCGSRIISDSDLQTAHAVSVNLRQHKEVDIDRVNTNNYGALRFFKNHGGTFPTTAMRPTSTIQELRSPRQNICCRRYHM